ncbi:MAG: hypothetical protein IJ047_00785 [Paludibacteraceae bacterium]|nr:hypothetical protein [Paludibacteraceae bacterium]
MDRKTLYHIIEWSVAFAACVFLVYKIATYDDYAALGETLRGMGWQQWTAIALCVTLMPLNMALEAWRWRTLVPMSWRDAHRQVYYSKLAGLITPWRLGEYPARGVLMTNPSPTLPSREGANMIDKALWSKVLAMGAVGSATMTAAILLAGVTALAFSPAIMAQLGDSYLYALVMVILVLMIAFALAPKALKKYAEVNGALVVKSIAQSFVRLVCWCVQLALVLWALGAVSLQPSAFSLLFVYYLLVTVTPNVPIVEIGVRGAWAILVFGTMNAAMAGVLLWIINTLLPCAVWVFLKKNAK